MVKYFCLLKINPTRTNDAIRTLKALPDKPWNGVRLYYTMNCFGNWDTCLWFHADKHEQAMDFVHNKIYPIPGVAETYLVPTTPIKEYPQNWKDWK